MTTPTAKTVVRTEAAPAPAHTFSQGVRKGGLLQVSGQGAVDPRTGEYVGAGDVREQTRRTLENVRAVLSAGGAGVEDVLMFRVYLTRRDDFPAMNEVYARHVGPDFPARATVQIAGLPSGALVEIEVVAHT